MRRILATLLIAFVALGPAHAFAQSNSPSGESASEQPELTKAQQKRVLELIDTGKAAYNEGRFDNALESFQAAHELYPHPDIVYRMALCHERLGEDEQAVRYYKRFLTQVPDAPERPRIEKTIQLIESRISKSEIKIVTQPDGAVVYIDDVANGAAGYTPTELPVKPGNYRVIVKKEGFETVEELVEVRSGQTVGLRYQLNSVGSSGVVSGPGTTDGNVSGKANTFDPTWVILMAMGFGAFTASVLFYQPYRSKVDNIEKLESNPQNVSREVVEEERSARDLYLGLTIGTAALGVGLLIWSWISYESTSGSSASLDREGADWAFGLGVTPDGTGPSVGLSHTW